MLPNINELPIETTNQIGLATSTLDDIFILVVNDRGYAMDSQLLIEVAYKIIDTLYKKELQN